jgi:alkanesulfonate monooxygenase SsuD/methylene tetrahydromethanopterin reductase-like flavin-dependent oxidoreductase (luciferase family)
VAALHLGVILPNYGSALDAEHLAAVALSAEESGLHSGWVTDHLIVPDEHAPVYGNIAEPLVTLGFLAARTRKLKLGVSALVVPQRNPLVALKQLALRISVLFGPEPTAGKDERGRHAIAGPPEWVAERLSEYVEAGCDGFVVNLDYESPGLEDRVRRFAADVAPLL